VPADTQIVDYTWRYVNKKGGPDRRFNFNKQLPVCLFSEMDIESPGGLRAKLHLSNAESTDRFVKVIDITRRYTSDVSQFRSITSVKFAKTWPTALLACVTTFFAAAIATPSLISLADLRKEVIAKADKSTRPPVARNPAAQAETPFPAALNPADQNFSVSVAVPMPKPRPRQHP
jgi:hypothetical protein